MNDPLVLNPSPSLKDLADTLLTEHAGFREAHDEFDALKQEFKVAATNRNDAKQRRRNAIAALESVLKKIKAAG